jgi:hypothetical protein
VGVDLATWRTVAASVAGTSHAAAGEPCADACAVSVLADGTLVAVAADGAGASPRAAEGARLACAAVVEEAAGREGSTDGFTPAEARRCLATVRRRIEAAASSEGLASRAFSCTLLVALVGPRSAVFLQVGDGAIVYRGPEGQYLPAVWPQTGEYANTTWFVTDDDVAERLQTVEVDGVEEVALLTDGLQGLALRFGTREVHGPFFAPMFERLRQEADHQSPALHAGLAAFLDSPAVNQRTDDDKTLVLATRLRAGAAGDGPP